MIMDIPTYSTISRFCKFVEIAKDYDKPVYVIFTGIGPLSDKTKKEKVLRLLHNCSKVILRDKQSNGVLNSCYAVSFDPAFLCKTEEKKYCGEYIVINVINPNTFSDGQFNQYLKFYFDLLEELTKNEMDIVILISEKKDIIMGEELLKSFKKIKVIFPSTYKEFVHIIANSKFVFGTRMHTLIIAYTQCVPIIGFKWQDKISGFFDNVKLPQNMFEIKSENIAAIVDKYYEVSDNKEKYILSNKNNLELIRDNIESMFLSVTRDEQNTLIKK